MRDDSNNGCGGDYIFIGYRNNRYFPHTNPYKCANHSSHVTVQRPTYKELLYEAVFISKLTCQFSSFFVQNFVQTTSTLSKQRPHFAKTTSPLRKERRQFCTTNVHILYERQLCTKNIEFERTTSTLYEQHRV